MSPNKLDHPHHPNFPSKGQKLLNNKSWALHFRAVQNYQTAPAIPALSQPDHRSMFWPPRAHFNSELVRSWTVGKLTQRGRSGNWKILKNPPTTPSGSLSFSPLIFQVATVEAILLVSLSSSSFGPKPSKNIKIQDIKGLMTLVGT